MKKYSKLLLYGFLTWLIPFLVSVLIFPLHQTERPLFESIMPVVIVACAVFFSVLYFRRVTSGFQREGAWLGAAWLAISLFIDLLLFMEGPMKMPLADYLKDIGLTYLIIPIITIGFGYLLERYEHMSNSQQLF
ncbi:MAG TPA: hypothetical protein VLB04_05570 [Methanotrichaceae archaeon]|nr:hypothetical protein [Methanotrichaceae archaeon]